MIGKFVIAGLFFAFMVASGLWLSHTGRPINVLILTVHKLISLGAVVFLGITVYRIHQAASLTPLELAACVLTLVFILALMATGGLLSTAKAMPGFVLKIHQVLPALSVLSTAATLYLLLLHKS